MSAPLYLLLKGVKQGSQLHEWSTNPMLILQYLFEFYLILFGSSSPPLMLELTN